MLAEKNKQIEKAVFVLKELSQDERTRLLYEEREKQRMDEEDRLDGAIQKSKVEIAKNALNKGIAINDIADITGLSIKEIEELTKL